METKTRKMFATGLIRFKQYLPLVLYIAGGIFLVPFIWLISVFFRILALVILRWRPNYGKMTNFYEGFYNEDFVHGKPKCTIVTSLTLDGDISVEKVQSLFTRNVLEQKISEGPQRGQIRYPEFKQYITTFMGFRVWKNVPYFHIDNHIFERSPPNNNSSDSASFTQEIDMNNLHEELCNKRFYPRRSPWDITIIRHALITNERCDNPKTILYFRIHHILGDGKSIHKVLVEGLGGKKLHIATPTAQMIRTTLLEKTVNVLTFPIQYILFLAEYSIFAFKYHLHPWKLHMYGSPPLIVKFTKSLDLNVIKSAAKRNGVACSSLIMSMISDAIKRYDGNVTKGGLPLWYILPKENHPPRLTNHMYTVYAALPTNEGTFSKQLQKCNEMFVKWKTSNIPALNDAVTYEFGTLFYPFVKIFTINVGCIVGITNVAGDRDGFSVGGLPCSDFLQSMGLLSGCGALVVVIVSYKDTVRFTISGNSTIFTEVNATRLIAELETVFHKLPDL